MAAGSALDDFGAGFASFYYLKHLPFDYVKIDGDFIQSLKDGPVDRLMVEAVVRIAAGLGIETIAEFVTDAETEAIVSELPASNSPKGLRRHHLRDRCGRPKCRSGERPALPEDHRVIVS